MTSPRDAPVPTNSPGAPNPLSEQQERHEQPALTPSERASRFAVAEVQRELAALAAQPAVPPRDAQRRHRRRASGASVVYTMRLGHDEVDELERRADVLGIPPSVLARNYIRAGLRTRGRTVGGHAFDEVDDALARLRDTLG